MWGAAVVGLALAAVASTLFLLRVVHGTYVPGTILDSLWLAAGLTLTYAAWQPHEEPMAVKMAGPRRLTATSIGAAAALTILVVGQFFSVGFAAVALAAAALVAVIARAAVSFKESLQMFADARLEAQTDSLTGLGNRRKLMTDLRRELQRRERRSRRACWCCSTSTGSSATTTPTATPPATSLLTRLGGEPRPRDQAVRRAPTGSAATSSACWS